MSEKTELQHLREINALLLKECKKSFAKAQIMVFKTLGLERAMWVKNADNLKRVIEKAEEKSL